MSNLYNLSPVWWIHYNTWQWLKLCRGLQYNYKKTIIIAAMLYFWVFHSCCSVPEFSVQVTVSTVMHSQAQRWTIKHIQCALVWHLPYPLCPPDQHLTISSIHLSIAWSIFQETNNNIFSGYTLSQTSILYNYKITKHNDMALHHSKVRNW